MSRVGCEIDLATTTTTLSLRDGLQIVFPTHSHVTYEYYMSSDQMLAGSNAKQTRHAHQVTVTILSNASDLSRMWTFAQTSPTRIPLFQSTHPTMSSTQSARIELQGQNVNVDPRPATLIK
jgi:hypothetical protein